MIDFSDTVVSARIQDIAITLVQFCCTAFWHPDGMSHYLRGYESVNVLSLDEKECLFACLELRLLNILLIPYLDTGLGEQDSFREQTLRYQKYLYRLHEFGKENFEKLIPQCMNESLYQSVIDFVDQSYGRHIPHFERTVFWLEKFLPDC